MLEYKPIIYTDSDLKLIEKYKISGKVQSANKRFVESICTIDVLNSVKRTGFKCLYCNENLIPATWQLDHFNPRAMGGKNIINNLAPSCKWCNQMKNALDGYAFLKKCKNIFLKNQDTLVPHKTKKKTLQTLLEYS